MQEPRADDPGPAPTRRVPLGGECPAELRQLHARVSLVENPKGNAVERVLGPHTHFQLQDRLVRPRLHIAERCFHVSRARVDEALQLVAAARLGIALGDAYEGPWVSNPSPTQRAAVKSVLDVGERWLGLCPTDAQLSAVSPVLGDYSTPRQLLLTDARVALLAISAAGDVNLEEITPDDLKIAEGVIAWRGQRLGKTDDAQLVELTRAAQLPLAKRQTRAAAAAVRSRAPHHKPWALAALRRAQQLGDARATAALYWLALMNTADNDPPPPAPETTGDINLAEIWEEFGFSRQAVERLFTNLPDTVQWRRAAIDLSSRSSEIAVLEAENESSVVADVGLAHAARLCQWGARARAIAALDSVEQHLPPLQLGHVDLPTDLTDAAWSQRRLKLERTRVRCHDAVTERCASLQRLVALAPLELATLGELADAAKHHPNEPDLAARAEAARALLGEAKTADETPTDALTHSRRLSDEQLGRTRHPLAVEHERFLARLEALTAKTETPDPRTLEMYCERVTSSTTPLGRSVDEAATLLGLGHVDIYVSRGHDDIGVRAFDDRPTVLMVGGEHLDGTSRHQMSEAEMRFAIGAELAHLRFGHSRVAPREVIGGVLDKGRRSLDLTLGLLPLFAGLKLGNRLGLATAKLSLPQLSRWAQAARQLEVAVRGRAAPNQRSDLSVANEALIEAHRFCQLSADRAGLLCAGDLTSAVRAMLLTRTDYVRVTTRLQQCSLLDSIDQARAGKPAAFDDLLMRIGFLIAFYVSDDYAKLRSASRSVPSAEPDVT